MERRTLGVSDLMITPIGLGTWAIGGGDWFLGWGPQDVRDSVATIKRAVAVGVNWIDTAAVFGLGHAERVIARALRPVPRNERPYIFTRCGLVWDDLGNVSHDLSAASIRELAESSLTRLNTDAIDLFQLGWPQSPMPQPGPGSLDEAWEAMAALKQEGKVRHIGIASCIGTNLFRLHDAAPVTSLTAPYSVLRREVEHRALPFCESNHIGFLACSTLASGLLTGKMTGSRVASLPCNDWRRRHPFFKEVATTVGCTNTGLHAVEQLQQRAEREGKTPAQLAVGFALRHRAVTGAIVGARRPQQIEEIVAALTDTAQHTHVG